MGNLGGDGVGSLRDEDALLLLVGRVLNAAFAVVASCPRT